jgi:MFS family permease
MGVHNSTMRAAVTDLVPRERRGAGYGVFTAVYGMAWLVGAAGIGWLYEQGLGVTELAVAIVQVVALALLIPVLKEKAAA